MNPLARRFGIAAAAVIAACCALGASPAFADLAVPPAHGQGHGNKPADKGKPDDKGKRDDKGPTAAAASGQASAAAAVSGAPSAGPAASGNPSADPAASAAPGRDPEKVKGERRDRAKKERDELKAKVKEKLKNQPMSQALKEELKRHARRVARILRVKEVAQSEKDDASVTRCDELLKKEQARHDKWMASYDAKGGAK